MSDIMEPRTRAQEEEVGRNMAYALRIVQGKENLRRFVEHFGDMPEFEGIAETVAEWMEGREA